jgi:hypothetical protein
MPFRPSAAGAGAQGGAWARLVVAVGLGLLILWRATAEPPPAPAGAAPAQFSSGRAMADVRRIAAEPHPTGSAVNRRVRDLLSARLTALGLSPRVQRDLSVASRDGGAVLHAAQVENIVGVLAGEDGALPALALMAHYDSAPGSPGAGDDAAGVAAVLETVRAIQARGRPRRDVVVVLTDGEEAGLLGAGAFYARDPLARRIGTVINLEARGGAGRAVMFETGAGSGDLVRALQRTAVGPTANSLADFVYRRMPYGTDLTPAMAAGKAGLNFAFAGRQFDYHAPTATPANLSEGALQSMGAQVLALAADLAFAPQLPARTNDLVFADVLGAFILAYPPWMGWLVLAASAGLLALAWRRSGTPMRLGGLTRGVLGGAAMLAAGGVLLWLARAATGAGESYLAQRALVARFGLWEAAMASVCAAALVLAARLSGRRGDLPSAWMGLLLSGLAAAAVVQVLLPLGAHILAWPLALAATAAAVSRLATGRGWPAGVALVAAAAIGLAWIGGLFHLIALGLDLPPALAVFVWLAGFALWPLVQPLARGRAGWVWVAVLLSIAAALVGAIRFASPWSPRHPQPTLAYYVADLSTGAFWRAAAAVGPSAWTDAMLGAEGGAPQLRAFPPLLADERATRAKPVAVADPGLRLRQGGDGAVVLDIPAMGDARALTVQVRSSVAVADARIDGRPVAALPSPGAWTTLTMEPATSPLALTFRPQGPAKVEVRYALIHNGWPADAPPLPPRPPTVAAWADSDALAVVGALALESR